MFKARWLCVCLGTVLYGQTLVDLRTQTKTVDFSGANATKPFKSGTVLPSICQVGEMFYKSDASAGANLYGCTALNSWTLQSGTLLPATFSNAGKVLSTDGSSYLWTTPGGDFTGSIGAATVVQIQGRSVSGAMPTSGQVLTWNTALSRWEPQTLTTGGGGGGASASNQLTDFAVVKTGNSGISVGATCSAASPCSVRFGSVTYTFTSGASVNLLGGTGFAYFYISSSGSLMAGHNMNLSCSAGCVAQSGVTSFPPDSIPLWVWSATNGTWDNNGLDQRAFLTAKNVIPGVGITTMDQAGQTVVALDPTVASIQVATPASAGSACTQGNFATDGSFFYLCVANNLWKRASLSSW